MPWTLFWDMYSGGYAKEPFEKIYIEASEEDAKAIFYNMFGHSADRITCTCCGNDYSVMEYDTLEEASAFHGGFDKNVKIIRSADIKDDDRCGSVPQQGWVYI